MAVSRTRALFISLDIGFACCRLFLTGGSSFKIKGCVAPTLTFYLVCAPSEVAVPSVIILNTSNEQYFLPGEPTETMEQLVQFITGVLNGSVQV